MPPDNTMDIAINRHIITASVDIYKDTCFVVFH